MRGSASALFIGALALAPLACGGGNAQNAGAVRADVRVGKGTPPVAVVAREGDPRSGMALAVMTAGIAPGRGAEVAVALAALIEARLEAAGVQEASVVAGWDGYRVRVLAAPGANSFAAGAKVADAVRVALLTRVEANAPEMAKVHRKLAALAVRKVADPALLDAIRCTGEAFAMPKVTSPSEASVPLGAPELEAWRRAAHGTGRLAFGTAGDAAVGESVARAVARGGAWPAAATPPSDPPLPARDAPAEIYDATGDVPAGGARVTLAVHTPRAALALAAAAGLGDARGPLASRLGALDAPARVRDVTATAHARGGCLAVTIEIAPRDLASDSGTRIATATALARQELGVEVAEVAADADLGLVLARRAGDPREAAERAAWWALTKDGDGETRIATAIGIAGGRDAPPDVATATAKGTPVDTSPAADALRSALDRATVAWHEPVIDARVRVERGQGDLWVLLASPCGTLTEGDADAGVGAAMAMATARRVGDAALDVQIEGWVTPDGIGVIAHAPPLPGEPPLVHARRVADVAARRFAADPLDLPTIAHVRGQLLRASEQDDARALVALGSARVPGHPSWLSPLGTLDALGRSSDASVVVRASVMRAGPLRAAVLANTDAAEGDGAIRALDRWVARRPGEARACPVPSTPPPARPGTYAVEAALGGSTEAWLALALPPNDATARTNAAWLAATLDGRDGLLARAVGGGLARTWSARVIGPTRAPSLVVRVGTAPGALDAAVAQTRALLDRLRQGAMVEADRTRAGAARTREDLAAALDPRSRLVALFRGDPVSGPVGSAATPPPLDALRAFAATTLRDDALIIVAVRPARPKTP